MAMNGNGHSVPEGQQFERELVELMPYACKFARSLTRNQEAAEDLAQEAFAKALKGRSSFAVGTNLKAWLFTIIRNKFYDDQQRAWRQLPWDDSFLDIPDGSERMAAPEAAMHLSQALECLNKINPDCKNAILLISAGYSYSQTATLLHCPEGTIKSRVARGRAELAELLAGPSLE